MKRTFFRVLVLKGLVVLHRTTEALAQEGLLEKGEDTDPSILGLPLWLSW